MSEENIYKHIEKIEESYSRIRDVNSENIKDYTEEYLEEASNFAKTMIKKYGINIYNSPFTIGEGNIVDDEIEQLITANTVEEFINALEKYADAIEEWADIEEDYAYDYCKHNGHWNYLYIVERSEDENGEYMKIKCSNCKYEDIIYYDDIYQELRKVIKEEFETLSRTTRQPSYSEAISNAMATIGATYKYLESEDLKELERRARKDYKEIIKEEEELHRELNNEAINALYNIHKKYDKRRDSIRKEIKELKEKLKTISDEAEKKDITERINFLERIYYLSIEDEYEDIRNECMKYYP